jgi:hypothetical protein
MLRGKKEHVKRAERTKAEVRGPTYSARKKSIVAKCDAPWLHIEDAALKA